MAKMIKTTRKVSLTLTPLFNKEEIGKDAYDKVEHSALTALTSWKSNCAKIAGKYVANDVNGAGGIDRILGLAKVSPPDDASTSDDEDDEEADKTDEADEADDSYGTDDGVVASAADGGDKAGEASDDLQNCRGEVLVVVGMEHANAQPTGGKIATPPKSGNNYNNGNNTKGGKRELFEPAPSSSNNAAKEIKSSNKRLKISFENSKKSDSISDTYSTTTCSWHEFEDSIRQLSTEEIFHMAHDRYSALLNLGGIASSSDNFNRNRKDDGTTANSNSRVTLHAVASSLSAKEWDLLETLCQVLRSKKIILNITKEFHPGKTKLCIASSATLENGKGTENSDNANDRMVNIAATSRTMKIMRAALAGIPIVTTSWMEACLREMAFVTPSTKMVVHTVPMKRGEEVRRRGAKKDHGVEVDQFVAVKFAAAAHRGQNSSGGGTVGKLLNGIAVMICGVTNKRMNKDLKTLLNDAGAAVIESDASARKVFSEILGRGESTETVTVQKFLFLCGESVSDDNCGISEALLNDAKDAAQNEKAIGVVFAIRASWLFDCISCATFLPAADYEPRAPWAKELWKIGI